MLTRDLEVVAARKASTRDSDHDMDCSGLPDERRYSKRNIREVPLEVRASESHAFLETVVEGRADGSYRRQGKYRVSVSQWT